MLLPEYIDEIMATDLRMNLNSNPIIQLAGHILLGGAASIGGFLGGSFIQGIAQAIGFTALNITYGGVPILGSVVGGLTFAGYVGYQLLYGA